MKTEKRYLVMYEHRMVPETEVEYFPPEYLVALRSEEEASRMVDDLQRVQDALEGIDDSEQHPDWPKGVDAYWEKAEQLIDDLRQEIRGKYGVLWDILFEDDIEAEVYGKLYGATFHYIEIDVEE